MNYKKKLYDLFSRYSNTENDTENFLKRITNEHKKHTICIFGAGNAGRAAYNALTAIDVHIDFFVDNDPKKNNGNFNIHGIPCISFDQLKAYENNLIIFVAMGDAEAVINQIQKEGYSNYLNIDKIHNKLDCCSYTIMDRIEQENKLLETYDMLNDNKSQEVFTFILKKIYDWNFISSYEEIKSENQYFDSDVVHLKNSDVLIDAGAYDGDTILDFLKISDNNFNKIYAFELDKWNYDKLQKNIEELPQAVAAKIMIINKGLGEKSESINYIPSNKSTVILTDDNLNENVSLSQAELVPLDETINDNVTFIKMDIEGAELSALKGARHLIQKYKPTLAICVYHKFSDLWEIPLYIKKLVPEYKIYFRHYADCESETVCYAVIDGAVN